MLQHAISCLVQMRRDFVQPNMPRLGEEWRQALCSLREVRRGEIGLDVIAYNAAISACEKGTAWQEALARLAELRIESLSPPVITYGAVISACEYSREWRQALSLFSEMQGLALRANVITLNAAVSACEQSQAWRNVISLMALMEELAVDTDVTTYNAAIGSCCLEADGWVMAFELLRDLLGRALEPEMLTFNMGVLASSGAQHWRTALRLFDEMLAWNILPDAIGYPWRH